jgi:hypothetical protein
MRLAAFLLALLACCSVAPHGAARAEHGRPRWTVVYNTAEGLYATSENRRAISFRSLGTNAPLGANALAAVSEQQLLIVDVDGVAVYRLSWRRSPHVSDLALTSVSALQDFLLYGTTRDGRFLVVSAKQDLDRVLLALPVTGRAQDKRKLPVSGWATILPAPAGGAKDQRSLLGILKHPFVADDPSDLFVMDISAGSTSELARLPNVLDAAWCRASGKLIAILAPKYARQLHLPGNLVEWEFGTRRVKVLGEGMSFTPPIVDGGDYVISGLAPSDKSGTHELAMVSRPHDRSASAYRTTRRILKVPGDPTNLYITSSGHRLFLLAWPKPRAHSISRWARLISYDPRTGRSGELAHEANHYTVLELGRNSGVRRESD